MNRKDRKKKGYVLEIYQILSSLSWNQSWLNLSRIDLNSMQFFHECSKLVLYRNIFVWKRRERKKKRRNFDIPCQSHLEEQRFRGYHTSDKHEYQTCANSEQEAVNRARRGEAWEKLVAIYFTIDEATFSFFLCLFFSLSSPFNPWCRLRVNKTKGNKNNNNNNTTITTGRENAFST